MLLIVWAAPSKLVICIFTGLFKAADNAAGLFLYCIFTLYLWIVFSYILKADSKIVVGSIFDPVTVSSGPGGPP